MEILVILILLIVTITLSSILNGWALSLLWSWFMVPLGLPPIGIAWAIGISIVIGYLTNHNEKKKGEEVDSTHVVIVAFMRPVFAVGIGYIVHSFMT